MDKCWIALVIMRSMQVNKHEVRIYYSIHCMLD